MALAIRLAANFNGRGGMRTFTQLRARIVRALTSVLRAIDGIVQQTRSGVGIAQASAKLHCLIPLIGLTLVTPVALGSVPAQQDPLGCGGISSCQFIAPDGSGFFNHDRAGHGSSPQAACEDMVRKKNIALNTNKWTGRAVSGAGLPYQQAIFPAGSWQGANWGMAWDYGTGLLCRGFDEQGNATDFGPSYLNITKQVPAWNNQGYTCPPNATYTGGGTCQCDAGYEQGGSSPTACSKMKEENQTQVANCARCLYGKPIDPLVGAEIWYEDTGLALRGAVLKLTYDSVTGQRPTSPGNITSLVEPDGFGALWHSSLHQKLQVSPDRRGALLTIGDGRVFSFAGDGVGNFTGSGFNNTSLVTSGLRYVFTDINTGTVAVFVSTGQLESITKTDGSVLKFTYSGGSLNSVTDSDSRSVSFVYTNNLVTRIVGPDGRVITAAYDTNRNLTSLTWADGKTRNFVYENPALPWALTGVVDENGARHATFTYDSEGRALSEELAGGINKYAVSYSSGPTWTVRDTYDAATDTITRVHAWQAPVGTVVTTPNGQNLEITAQSVLGMPLPAAVSQPAGSGNVATATNRVFDAKGNVTAYDDPSGMRTCSVYDARNRVTVRVEGLSNTVACNTVTAPTDPLPSGARRIGTTWHPDWKLPEVVVGPRRKTTYVYHGRPDPFNSNVTANCTPAAPMPNGKPLPVLCKRVEQALLPSGAPDPNAASSAVSQTYDSAGRILSKTDPKGLATTLQRYSSESWSDGDPEIGKVVLLVHGDGVAGTNSIVDTSPRNRQLTAAGGAKISATQARFGSGSISFSAAGDYLSIPYTKDLDYGSSDFTVEMHVYKISNNSNASRLWNANGDLYDGLNMHIDGNGNFAVYLSTNGTSWTHSLTAVANLANGQWYHLAVSRVGTAVYAFVNGAMYTVTTSLGTASLYANPNSPRVIGGQGPSPYRILNGYVDDVRITMGKARYSSAFTPPSNTFADAAPSSGYSKGDIQSVSDAAGHVVQYLLYDGVHRVRRMVDPKGTVTDITYSPRGWVNTVTVAPPGGTARVTTYAYDGVGQLVGVSMPEGVSISYSYDAAHRLVGVTDSRGNAVTYSLDSSGNRIAEEVRDPAGALQRSISRSFDALQRVQQVTGAAQ
jgi:YD repeat-containing protein